MIAEFESRILALIDGMVDHASDDELFASGYLRGHLTLAIAELESGDDHSAQAVHTPVSHKPVRLPPHLSAPPATHIPRV